MERILRHTDLSMEQKTAIRGQWRLLKESVVSKLKAVAFVMPLGFALALYSSHLDKAIFWAIMAILGYRIYKD